MKRYIFITALALLGIIISKVSSQVTKYPHGSSVSLSNTIACSGSSVNIDGNTVYVDCSANEVGIGTGSPETVLDVNGGFQTGSGVTKSTFSSTGALSMAASADVTLSRSAELINLSSITAGGDIRISTAATAALANRANIRIDQFGIIHSTTQIGARLTMSVAESIGNSTFTHVFFDGESFDQGDLHSVSVSSHQITIPTGGDGIWFINCSISLAANATGSRILAIITNGTRNANRTVANAGGSDGVDPEVTDLQYLSAGDIVACQVWQNSTAPLATTGGATRSNFVAFKIW